MIHSLEERIKALITLDTKLFREILIPDGEDFEGASEDFVLLCIHKARAKTEGLQISWDAKRKSIRFIKQWRKDNPELAN